MKKAVLFITTNLPGASTSADIELYRETILFVTEHYSNDEYELTIKLHPGENIEYYEYLINAGKQIKIMKRGNLYELIKNSGMVIGMPSTALLEANELGKECYFINPWKKELPYPFNTQKMEDIPHPGMIKLESLGYFSRSKIRLIEVIDKILNNDD